MYLKRLATVNFLVSATSLSFSVFVLYPWHLELSNQVDRLEKKIIANEETINKIVKRR